MLFPSSVKLLSIDDWETVQCWNYHIINIMSMQGGGQFHHDDLCSLTGYQGSQVVDLNSGLGAKEGLEVELQQRIVSRMFFKKVLITT